MKDEIILDRIKGPITNSLEIQCIKTENSFQGKSIFLLLQGKVFAMIQDPSKNDSKQDWSRDLAGEYILCHTLFNLPAELIPEFIPTVLAFLRFADLLPWSYQIYAFPDENYYCLYSGQKLAQPGFFASYKPVDQYDYKKADEYYQRMQKGNPNYNTFIATKNPSYSSSITGANVFKNLISYHQLFSNKDEVKLLNRVFLEKISEQLSKFIVLKCIPSIKSEPVPIYEIRSISNKLIPALQPNITKLIQQKIIVTNSKLSKSEIFYIDALKLYKFINSKVEKYSKIAYLIRFNEIKEFIQSHYMNNRIKSNT